VNSSGYGYPRLRGVDVLAHRVFYESHVGAIPAGLFVLHRCDVRSCVNPDHLFIGTIRDNVRDAVQKGRWADRRGERNGRSKLTAALVKEIRCALAAGETQTALGPRYGVSQSLISDIALGIAWRHVA
jgi:hypothetical protein